ncbi:alpha/beta fold hydrolase [Niveispirillum sp. KHB5.9]|uniref:alpha/beta fold hydrolase n=1 Tax=Niveispirillum sp. KHB5.9 TaxID=3400269 RepID=UPI003A85E8CD
MSAFTRWDFTTPDGLTLVGEVGGPPDAPTVILLHGGGQTRHSWSRTMNSLVGGGYRVINYDARGHGESAWSPTGDYSIQALAADLRAVRATVHGPVAFVGASMGGLTGFYTVGSGEPPAAQALVMVDIVLSVASAGVEKIRRFMQGHRNGFADLAEAVEAVIAYNPERPRPRDPSGLRRNLRQGDDGRLYWHWDPRLLDVSPSSEPPSRLDALVSISSRVHIPTLVIRGGRSDIVNDEGIAEMRRLVPQTQVYEVPAAGHMVAGDQNDAFSAGVVSFLDRHFPAA